MKWGYVVRNVCQAVDKPRVPKRQMKCLDAEQASRFLEAAKQDRLYAMYVLALATGMRQGELLGLRWEDVNWRTNTLSVQRTLQDL